jgi:hydrogenase nickel incorporation protein HypA/HybF
MHELTVTQSILEIALRHAQQAGGQRITDLYLVVGQLSSIVDDSVQFYWDFVSENSLAERAKLHFRRVPAELSCLDCQTRYSPDDNLECPGCGGVRIRVVAGDEFYLDAIEVSDATVSADVSVKD